MTTAPRVGLTLPSFREEIDPLLDVAIAAERAGLDGVFAYDHLFRYGVGGEVRPALELAPALGALAAATDAIAIGSLVAPTMKEKGYHPDFTAALLSVAGTLALIEATVSGCAAATRVAMAAVSCSLSSGSVIAKSSRA